MFGIRCENVNLSRWSYFIEGCNISGWNTQFLNNVPLDNVKNWIITKTSTHLKVVCNRVTVLNFNFSVDCVKEIKDGDKLWSFKAKSFTFYIDSKYCSSKQMLVRNLICLC